MILNCIFALIIGVLLGNFTSTVLFRLPRKIPIHGYNPKLGKVPHCSTCGHTLKFYEYLPMLSWVSTRGRCNYCGVKINPEYTILEVFISILAFILYFFTSGFSEEYILLLFSGAGLILSCFLIDKAKTDADKALFMVGILGSIFRTLSEGTIFGWLTSFLFAYFIYAFITSKLDGKKVAEYYSLRFILLSGVWLSIPYLLAYLLVLFLLTIIKEIPQYRKNIFLIALLYIFIIVVEYK
ncbi:prepilin peptidase [Holosporaceae bacterium 'Namur']|nr:prepilin peptidase [Holosporaceae bacterium 'Namur']